MTYTARESSQYLGAPYEMYWFATQEQSWFYTSADEGKTYNLKLYTPEAITHTDSSQGAELAAGEIKVTIPLSNPIAALFVSYIPSSPLWLTLYRAHDGEAETETVVHWVGKVSKAMLGDACELTCTPERDVLKKHIPFAKYQPQCNRILYDAGCGIQRLAWRMAATLTSVSGDVIKAAAFAASTIGTPLNNGYIEKGADRRMILNHSGDTCTLISGMPGLAVGDNIYVYAGCNRLTSDCVSKFNNLGNYFGFPWIPSKNPFITLT